MPQFVHLLNRPGKTKVEAEKSGSRNPNGDGRMDGWIGWIGWMQSRVVVPVREDDDVSAAKSFLVGQFRSR